MVFYYKIGLFSFTDYFMINTAGLVIIAALMFQVLNTYRISQRRKHFSKSIKFIATQNCDCLFESLSLTIWGDSVNHRLMRYWI